MRPKGGRLIERCSIVVGVAVWAFGVSVARADIPPADACTSPEQPCQVAGPHYDQPGLCKVATCAKGVPDGDGGITTMTYACNRCQLSAEGGGGAGGGEAGAGGASAGAGGASAGAGGASAGTGGTPVGTEKKSSGCAVAGSDPGAAAAVIGILALLAARRRRRVTTG